MTRALEVNGSPLSGNGVARGERPTWAPLLSPTWAGTRLADCLRPLTSGGQARDPDQDSGQCDRSGQVPRKNLFSLNQRRSPSRSNSSQPYSFGRDTSFQVLSGADAAKCGGRQERPLFD
jgi:hypothetical protein